jgi:hypothetical protein
LQFNRIKNVLNINDLIIGSIHEKHFDIYIIECTHMSSL